MVLSCLLCAWSSTITFNKELNKQNCSIDFTACEEKGNSKVSKRKLVIFSLVLQSTCDCAPELVCKLYRDFGNSEKFYRCTNKAANDTNV